MEDRKSEKRDTHILYKNLGETPNEAILRFKVDNPEYEKEPMTYAGRLDPMAEGLLLVLSGEELKNKDSFLDLKKTYEFEILWGAEADTLDVLGLISENSFSSTKFPEIQKLKEVLNLSVGKFEQDYPAFSSKPVDGKPLFMWAREGKINGVKIPKHKVELFEIKYISRRTISKEELLEEIRSKISKVNGDFRQEEILKKWVDVLEDGEEKVFTIDKLEATVSSGFYVRQFVKDFAKSFGAIATTFHIKRTKVGDYQI